MNTIKIEIVNGAPVYYNLLDGYSYTVAGEGNGTNAQQIQIDVKDATGTAVEVVTIVKPSIGTQDDWEKSHIRGVDAVADEIKSSREEIINLEMAESWSTAFEGSITNGEATYKEWIYFMNEPTKESIDECRNAQLQNAQRIAEPASQLYDLCGSPGEISPFKGPGGVIINCGDFPNDPEEKIRDIALAVTTNGVGCFERNGGFKKHMCSQFASVTVTSPGPA